MIAASSLAFMFILTAGIPSSNAAPSHSPDGSTATAAEAEDIEALAHGRGVPVDSASAVLAGGAAFTAAVEALRARFPDDFADAAFSSLDGEAPWLAFKGAVPDDALGLIEALPFHVEVRTNWPISERERELASGAALGAFSDVVRPDTATAWIEPGTTQIHISYQGGILPAGLDLDAAIIRAAQIAVSGLDESLTFTVSIEESDAPVAATETG